MIDQIISHYAPKAHPCLPAGMAPLADKIIDKLGEARLTDLKKRIEEII